MAATNLTHIQIPATWPDYVVEQTAERQTLLQSGVAQRNAQFDALANSPGKTVDLPQWDDLTGADEVINDTGSLTANNVTSDKDIAVILYRGKAFGVNDLAADVAGDDPVNMIADRSAAYWALRQQDVVISNLKGLFASGGALASTHQNAIAIEDGDNAAAANLVSGGAIIETATKLGDAANELSSICMHSTVYAALQKANLITTIRDADNNILFDSYLEKRLWVNDACPKVAGATSGFKYTSYLFAPGAIAMGMGTPKVPVETDRDSLGGNDYIINRQKWIIHPRGVKFTSSSVAGDSPTNAELETAGNWSKVWADKNIRVVALVSNG